MNGHRARTSGLILAAFLTTMFGVAAPLLAARGEEADGAIERWLALGPVDSPWPAFHGEGKADGGEFDAGELLGVATVAVADLWPAAGASHLATDGREHVWSELAAPGGTVELETGTMPREVYLAVYLETDRFLKPKLTVESAHRLRVFLDGEQVAEKKNGDGDGGASKAGKASGKGEAAKAAGKATAELPLPTGKHLLVVRALFDPAVPEPWTLLATLGVKEGMPAATPRRSLSPAHTVRLADLLDTEAVSGLALSPDGELLAVWLRQPEVPADWQKNWLEIRRAGDGSLVRSFRAAPGIGDFQWAGRGRRFSYVTREGEDPETATLWVGDLADGSLRSVREDLTNLEEGGYLWNADGASLLLGLTEKRKKDERGIQRLESLQDRWPGWRDKSHLYQLFVADGTLRRLTAGPDGASLEDVHPDGSRALLLRTEYVRERPFQEGEIFELDLATLETRSVTRGRWLNSASYSPDGRRVLVSGGTESFDELGVNLPPGLFPNGYDHQLYVVDVASGAVEALTRDFDPSVEEAVWSRHDGKIYLRAGSGERTLVFRLDPASGDFEELAAGMDVVAGMSLARSAPRLAYHGSSVTTPPEVRILDVDRSGVEVAGKPVLDPGADTYRHVTFGRVEDWSFENAEGTAIAGRVYYPPDFDPAREYPLLVYYYGGTAPTERSFGGRYPKNFWAANGYVVYVLQPSGATGFGQAFSALHVNDWGQRVAAEILRGVELFLEAHPFVDRDRIGCFGGSYGGFMTMLLITESDLFAAAISHAGISGIASYWGEGWWGYLYSAAASANSYPWNNPELYVGQSPLFSADQIRTPLLLLHGTADYNVPLGESDQMYVALSLLGREVEYIRIEGEAHWILTYPKRVLWAQTIMAWFDRHLKGQPEYWNHLYEEP